jgi:uncharacterized coiled-coil DUF342 family protein
VNSRDYKSQYDALMASPPPKPESYYNKGFADKVREARENIDNLVAERDKSWGAVQQAQDDYDAFNGTISTYDEVYTNSKREFGIEEHQQNYENSKRALALAESTLESLPSTINAGSNRVLTQSQREARYNALADRQMAYKSNLMAQSSAYEQVWKEAREKQSAYAQAEIASQYRKLGDYNNAWTMAMNQYNNAAKRATQGEVELASWQRQYRGWQQQQYQNANTVWLNQLSDALRRYTEAMDTEITNARVNAEMGMQDLRVKSRATKQALAKAILSYSGY